MSTPGRMTRSSTSFVARGKRHMRLLAGDIEKVLKRAASNRRPRRTRAPALRRLLDVFRERLAGIEHVDFFGGAGRDRVAALLTRLEDLTSGKDVRTMPVKATGPSDTANYQGRLWVTRPRPGVDRMASAWLIRRFIDPQAQFGFVADLEAVPDGALPFDMFGVEFSHQGEGCTFETLCSCLRDPATSGRDGLPPSSTTSI